MLERRHRKEENHLDRVRGAVDPRDGPPDGEGALIVEATGASARISMGRIMTARTTSALLCARLDSKERPVIVAMVGAGRLQLELDDLLTRIAAAANRHDLVVGHPPAISGRGCTPGRPRSPRPCSRAAATQRAPGDLRAASRGRPSSIAASDRAPEPIVAGDRRRVDLERRVRKLDRRRGVRPRCHPLWSPFARRRSPAVAAEG